MIKEFMEEDEVDEKLFGEIIEGITQLPILQIRPFAF